MQPLAPPPTTQRTFTLQNQQQFAALSGDYNPMHVDPIAARRLMFGANVVHGIHLVLWCLDAVSAVNARPVETVSAQFRKPVRVDEPVTASFSFKNDTKLKIKLNGQDGLLTTINIAFSTTPQEAASTLDLPRFTDLDPVLSVCQQLEPAAIPTYRETLPLVYDPTTAAALFPNLTAAVITPLLGVTYVVGMRCPGLNSIMRDVKLTYTSQQQPATDYRVTTSAYDPRHEIVTLALTNQNFDATVSAHVRPTVTQQASWADVQAVSKADFSQQTALVIGGSRGLGETITKLLACGNAKVFFTYHRGQAEAAAIVKSAPPQLQQRLIPIQLDVTAIDQLDTALAGVTDIYYCASPYIRAGSKKAFSRALYNRFASFYVTGLIDVVNAFAALPSANKTRNLFYPSTVFIEAPHAEFSEYTAAKQTGELICQTLQDKGLLQNAYVNRLPRLATDQTVSLVAVDTQHPLPIMQQALHDYLEVETLR